MVKRKALFVKSKHQYPIYQGRDCVFIAQSYKERGLLSESMFPLFKGWTLIQKKMVEWKAFLVKPNHQYHVS